MKLTIVLGWTAAGLLLAGLILGLFVPVSDLSGGPCGAVFDGNESNTSGDCAQAREALRQIPIILLVLGVALIGATFSSRETRSKPDAT